MKYIFYTLIAIFSPVIVFCQDITGLWKGTMFNDSTKQSLPYEVVISKEKGKYIGYSHSWFLIDGQKYYGIKKIKVRVAKDGKIVLQDDELIENNYPAGPDKNVYQLNVLDLATNINEAVLDGPFVTNRTKLYTALTGRITVRKVSPLTESDLMSYLQKSGRGNDVSLVK